MFFLATMGASWLVSVVLDFNTPWLMYAAGVAFGAMAGRWWAALLAVPTIVAALAFTTLFDAVAGGCSLCSTEHNRASAVLLALLAFAMPLTMFVAAGILARMLLSEALRLRTRK